LPSGTAGNKRIVCPDQAHQPANMFGSLMDQMPLTPEAERLRDEILAIPRTEEPMMDAVPEGLDTVLLEKLHPLALSGSQQAAPELRKLVARFPQYPQLLNLLQVAHISRDENRQAAAVLKKLAEEHPDYLFTRIALANKALDRKQPERAASALNPTLCIRDLYPDRELFHISELKNYYFCVARILARRGEPQLARGVKAALAVIDYDEGHHSLITREIMTANLGDSQKRLAEDQKRRVTVRPAPLPTKPVLETRPMFFHEETADLYECGTEVSENWIAFILSLPRKTLVKDLVAVIGDCITRTPNFMRGAVDEGEDFAVFHALHFLAEIRGQEAIPSLLQLLAMHPDAVDFWLGDTEAYIPQIARIIAGDLPACMAWLKQPGIKARSKGMITEAMEQIAKSDPARLPEIKAGLGEVLACVIDSPPQENLLDTGYLFILIGTLAELRAAELLPLIRKAYDKDLIELFSVGSYEDLESDMADPMRPPLEWLPMARQYGKYLNEDEDYEEAPDEDFPLLPPSRIPPLFSLPGVPPMNRTNAQPAPPAGRNDPCPCGSGRKYKKCCMD
jgi:tetratricopeptide (TPR) repeat protein